MPSVVAGESCDVWRPSSKSHDLARDEAVRIRKVREAARKRVSSMGFLRCITPHLERIQHLRCHRKALSPLSRWQRLVAVSDDFDRRQPHAAAQLCSGRPQRCGSIGERSLLPAWSRGSTASRAARPPKLAAERVLDWLCIAGSPAAHRLRSVQSSVRQLLYRCCRHFLQCLVQRHFHSRRCSASTAVEPSLSSSSC